jgi:hypothetical protein
MQPSGLGSANHGIMAHEPTHNFPAYPNLKNSIEVANEYRSN